MSGTDNYASGMLLNLTLIIGGTVAAVYLSTLTAADREAIFDHCFRLATVLLAQLGVFWTVRILTNQSMPLKKRCVSGLVVLFVFGMVLPVIIGSHLEESFRNFEESFNNVKFVK